MQIVNLNLVYLLFGERLLLKHNFCFIIMQYNLIIVK